MKTSPERAREATGWDLAASIMHEIKQPLAAIVADANVSFQGPRHGTWLFGR